MDKVNRYMLQVAGKTSQVFYHNLVTNKVELLATLHQVISDEDFVDWYLECCDPWVGDEIYDSHGVRRVFTVKGLDNPITVWENRP